MCSTPLFLADILGVSLRSRIRSHERWLRGSAGGVQADFSGELLSGEDLSSARLDRAIFRGTILADASLAGTIAMHADFQGANLRGANCRDAVLAFSDFQEAACNGTVFDNAILARANFETAYIDSYESLATADIRYTTLPTKGIPMIGWKKCMSAEDDQTVIVKLFIPSDAARYLFINEWRTDRAIVLEISGADTAISFHYGTRTVYRIGEEVRAEVKPEYHSYSGIYYFRSRDEAEAYFAGRLPGRLRRKNQSA